VRSVEFGVRNAPPHLSLKHVVLDILELLNDRLL